MSSVINNSVTAYPEWRILEQRFGQAPLGTKITHEEIETLTKLSRGPYYYGQITRWKKEMFKEHGRHVRNDKGTGYEITEANEYHRESRKKLRQAGRRVRESNRIAVTGLSEHASQMTPEAVIKTVNLAAQTGALELSYERTLKSTRGQTAKNLPKSPDIPKMLSGPKDKS